MMGESVENCGKTSTMVSVVSDRMILGCGVLFLFGVVFLSGLALAAETTVCCEETQSGLFCQDVPAEACSPESKQAPTACSSTSFCRAGTCFDSSEGTCLDGTPQLVCDANGGLWTKEVPPQCNLGCCVLGDQAAFVTLTRCKHLSAQLGLETHYRQDVTEELSCILSVQGQQKGACVYEFEFERTCKFTTQAECSAGIEGNEGEFFAGRLCSDGDLATNCGPSTETMCAPGKDGVYFVDTCGNPANIYDASKVEDKAYWSEVVGTDESCGFGGANAGSKSCGNCNYLAGSICRSAERGKRATYGDFICKNLNCKKTQDGTERRHGESWCVYNDAGGQDDGKNAVGSRYYKHICSNGEEVLEQCADFRQEECIEDSIDTEDGAFAQAACRVNRWQDCTAQGTLLDCENTDRRDCLWVENDRLNVIFGNLTGDDEGGACIPQNAPGIQFWQGEEALSICAQANAQCVITLEKGLFGGKECEDNCHCCNDEYDDCSGNDDWVEQHADICMAIGDCGPAVNWIGQAGYRPGYEKFVEKFSSG